MAAYFASLDFTKLLGRFPSGVAQGLIWGIMALGVYVTFRLLDIADLSVDGTFTTGAAVTVMLTAGTLWYVTSGFQTGQPEWLCRLFFHSLLGVSMVEIFICLGKQLAWPLKRIPFLSRTMQCLGFTMAALSLILIIMAYMIGNKRIEVKEIAVLGEGVEGLPVHKNYIQALCVQGGEDLHPGGVGVCVLRGICVLTEKEIPVETERLPGREGILCEGFGQALGEGDIYKCAIEDRLRSARPG